MSALLSVLMLVLFAYLSAYFPHLIGTFIVAYFLVALLAAAVIAGRSATAMLRDLEYVRAGKTVIYVSSDEVSRLRSRDRELSGERKAQAKVAIIQLAASIAVIVALLVPALRDALLSSLQHLIELSKLSGDIERFLAFLLFYGLLAAVMQAISYGARRYLDRIGGGLEIPSSYLVTDRGLILDGRVPLKAPIRARMRVDTRRKFLELQVNAPTGPRSGKSRIRLYYEDPRMLEAYLRALSEERG